MVAIGPLASLLRSPEWLDVWVRTGLFESVGACMIRDGAREQNAITRQQIGDFGRFGRKDVRRNEERGDTTTLTLSPVGNSFLQRGYLPSGYPVQLKLPGKAPCKTPSTTRRDTPLLDR
jgi:hypothetical protein